MAAYHPLWLETPVLSTDIAASHIRAGEAFAAGIQRHLGAVRQAQLAEDVADVGAHGPLADALFLGNLVAGEKKTLRLVARYGDACNLFMLPDVAMIRAKLEVLRRHCDEVGRPYDDIERTTLGTVHIAPGAMAASQVIETCRGLAGIGIQQAIFNMPNVHDITPLEVFGREIIPAVAGL